MAQAAADESRSIGTRGLSRYGRAGFACRRGLFAGTVKAFFSGRDSAGDGDDKSGEGREAGRS